MIFKSKDLAQISIFASLYVVLVYTFAPISFNIFQFRIAGILRPIIAKNWKLSFGYAIGVAVGNMASPFVGTWELIYMPFMSLIAGLLGYYAGKLYPKYDYYICGVVIAIIIPLSVSFMFYSLFNVPMFITFPVIFVSEQIINFIGASMFKIITVRWKAWRL
jgi:uncharacterized membrane protein